MQFLSLLVETTNSIETPLKVKRQSFHPRQNETKTVLLDDIVDSVEITEVDVQVTVPSVIRTLLNI